MSSGFIRSFARRNHLAALPAHWPLTVLCLGFPILWVLGISAFFPLFMAVPMAVQLSRRDKIRTPAGFTIWLLFLFAVAASGLMLWVDAPTAVPGGGLGRLPVFGYRLLWYSACAVVLLWVMNLDEDELPTRRVVNLLGWMFVITVAGGLLGMALPSFEFKSVVELVLPGALASNGFVKPLVHPAAASIQNMAGVVEARPIAPFEYANTWGANFSMFLPFFCVEWLRRDAGWKRPLAPVVLVLGALPVVSSLDRGLWGALVVGGVYLAVRLALRGQVLPLVASFVVVCIAAIAFMASPLSSSVMDRLNNPHSNDRRGQLLSQTVSSTLIGSPVLGFGGTRDVQGSFASIAGGSTPDCKACAVPPLGTQGLVWMELFTQGLVGAALFFGFILIRGAHHWRGHTTIEAMGMCLIIFFLVEALVYDTIGMSLYALMIGFALMWRERALDPLRSTDGADLGLLLAALRRQARLLAVFVLLGLVIGVGLATQLSRSKTSVVSILLAPAPVYLNSDDGKEPRVITIDTEAAMVFSEATINEVRLELAPDMTGSQLRRMIRVTAVPSTKVLQVHVSGPDAHQVELIAARLAEVYLDARREYLDMRRTHVVNQMNALLNSVDPTGAADESTVGSEIPVDGPDGGTIATADLRAEIESLLIEPSDPGVILRHSPAKDDRAQVEVPIVSSIVVAVMIGLAVASRREAIARRTRDVVESDEEADTMTGLSAAVAQ